jgi:hypothetical protein
LWYLYRVRALQSTSQSGQEARVALVTGGSLGGQGAAGHFPGGGGAGSTVQGGGAMTATVPSGVGMEDGDVTLSVSNKGGNGWMNFATNTTGGVAAGTYGGGQGGGPLGGNGDGYNSSNVAISGTTASNGCGGGGGRGGSSASNGRVGADGALCIWFT